MKLITGCFLFVGLTTTRLWADVEPLNLATAPKPDGATVVLLHLDEGSGEVAHDAGRLKNNGEAKGARYVDGKFGKALKFDGSNYVDLAGERGQPSCYDFGVATDFTIDFWMNTSSETKWLYLVAKKARADASEPGFSILLHNQHLKAFIADGKNLITLAHPENVVDGKWHHVALVAERKGNATLYVDGVAGEPVSMAQIGDITNTNRRMRIANRESEGNFEGLLDEVRISDVARKWKAPEKK